MLLIISSIAAPDREDRRDTLDLAQDVRRAQKLLNNMAEIAKSPEEKRSYSGKAQETQIHIDRIREMLLGPTPNAPEPDGGRGGSGWRHEMPRLGTGGAKLTLEVGLGELGVEQSHFWCRMAEQVHERREADAGAQHLAVSQIGWRRVGTVSE
jgi:hypothetical protein